MHPNISKEYEKEQIERQEFVRNLKIDYEYVIPKDVEGGMKFLDIACNDSNEPVNVSCKQLAKLYQYGNSEREPDPIKAEKFMKRACELEEWEACWHLSGMYMPQDQIYLGKGNRVIDPKRMEKKGIKVGQVPVNMQKALEYGIIACDNNIYQSCFNVSRMYLLGDGIPKDLDKAQEFQNKARKLLNLAKSQEELRPFTGQ